MKKRFSLFLISCSIASIAGLGFSSWIMNEDSNIDLSVDISSGNVISDKDLFLNLQSVSFAISEDGILYDEEIFESKELIIEFDINNKIATLTNYFDQNNLFYVKISLKSQTKDFMKLVNNPTTELSGILISENLADNEAEIINKLSIPLELSNDATHVEIKYLVDGEIKQYSNRNILLNFELEAIFEWKRLYTRFCYYLLLYVQF